MVRGRGGVVFSRNFTGRKLRRAERWGLRTCTGFEEFGADNKTEPP